MTYNSITIEKCLDFFLKKDRQLTKVSVQFIDKYNSKVHLNGEYRVLCEFNNNENNISYLSIQADGKDFAQELYSRLKIILDNKQANDSMVRNLMCSGIR